MLKWLLAFVPIAIALEYLTPQSHLLVFVAAAIAILPLAAWLGRATEQLADRSGEGVGGLLNATFGNAAELIIALAALRAGLHDVVKATIVGSIVGNILLVLGAAMLAGGMRHREQHFNEFGWTHSSDNRDPCRLRRTGGRGLSGRSKGSQHLDFVGAPLRLCRFPSVLSVDSL